MLGDWEWGVEYAGYGQGPIPWPHRADMAEEVARDWIREFEEDGGKPGTYKLVRRWVGEWEWAP